MTTATWTAPPIWSVPREWTGERAFVLCGGASINAQRDLIPTLRGRFVAVKHAVRFRPDADVLFCAGEHAEVYAPQCVPYFKGRHLVVRGQGHWAFPDHAKRIGRPHKDEGPEAHEQWSTVPTKVVGYDAGTSAISLAILFGAREVVLLGYDMSGGRILADEIAHSQPTPDEARHRKHMEPLPALAEDAKRNGLRIVNVSPISRVECFERGRLEDFL